MLHARGQSQHHVGEHRIGVDIVHHAGHLQQHEPVHRRPELQRRVEGVLTLQSVGGQHRDHRAGGGLGGCRVLGIVAAERHSGERRVSARVVVGVAAVGAGHHQHRVVAGASVTDGVQHPDDVADRPASARCGAGRRGCRRGCTATDPWCPRWLASALMVSASQPSRSRKRQRRVDDHVTAELGCSPTGARPGTRRRRGGGSGGHDWILQGRVAINPS